MVGMDFNNSDGWSEGTFTVLYFYVGQGDCMLVKCPNGETVMVDCGSSKGYIEDDIDCIRGQLLALCNGKTLDYLILTHPDVDHYSLVYGVLRGYTITNLIISCAYNNGSPLGNYTCNSINHCFYLGEFKTQTITEVTIRSKAKKLDEVEAFIRVWEVTDQFKSAVTTVLPDQKFVLFSENPGGNGYYEVAIIAGNVFPLSNKAKSSGEKNNSASLVTVFRLDDQKIIAWGDATNATELFVETHQSNWLADVVLTNIAHHGSGYTSNPPFISRLNAANAVVSVELGEHGYYLPNGETVQNYIDATNMVETDFMHPLDGWELAVDYRKGCKNQADLELLRWQDLDLAYTIEGTNRTPRYVLENPDDPENTDKYYMLVPSKGKMLARVEVHYSTRQVGIEASGLPFLFYSITRE